MEGEQFSLCWNNFHSNLSSGFHTLLKDEDLVDVTLAAEGRYLKAHKTVLSVCSPFFKELFRVNPCKHPIVVLQDVNYGALCSLLEFMYQGEVSVSQEEIPTFMRVAETLKVKGLTENASSGDANGIKSRPSSHGMPDPRDLSKRPKPVKKVIKPIHHLKPLETPSRAMKSPQPSNSQPPAKRPHLEDHSNSTPSPQPQQNHNNPPSPIPHVQPHPSQSQSHSSQSVQDISSQMITPKLEPVDPLDDNSSDQFMEDMSSLVDTKLGESVPSPQSSGSWNPDMQKFQDNSTPGTIQCILGRRGNPRLIVDGHVFYKKSTYKGKAFWYCKNNRTPDKCQAVCWTMNGNIIKWPNMHTHPVIPDVFNPKEDTEVPIESLQEVLWQSSLN